MKRLLVTFLLSAAVSSLAQGPSGPVHLKDAVKEFPRSELRIKSTGRVTVDTSLGARASYEQLARAAGLNIVFDADFRDAFSVPPKIVNAEILDALDLLSIANGSFVEMLNRDTIIVSPDNPTKRRDYELMVLKTFYLRNPAPQALTEVITGFRSRLQARYLAQSSSAGAIVMRDTPTRIALAEESLGGTGRTGISIASNATGHLFFDEPGSVRDLAPGRSAIRSTPAGSLSFEISGDSRRAFESLSKTAGMNVIFDPDFRSSEVKAFRVDNAGVLDALDLVSIQVRSFWEPLDSKTILVAPDNQTKRRDHDLLSLKVFRFSNAFSQRDLVEVATAVRTILNCRYVAIVNAANAFVIRDNPIRLALAERIIRDLADPVGSVTVSDEIPAGTEGGLVLSRRVARARDAASSELKPKSTGPFTLQMNNGARSSFESLAALSGLRLVFDNRFVDGPAQFKLENVDILDALDFLSIQTGNLWDTTDPETIVVAPDNPTVRRDLIRQSSKMIDVRPGTPGNVAEIVTVLRTLLNIAHVDAMGNAIVIQDRPDTVALAEKIVVELQRTER